MSCLGFYWFAVHYNPIAPIAQAFMRRKLFLFRIVELTSIQNGCEACNMASILQQGNSTTKLFHLCIAYSFTNGGQEICRCQKEEDVRHNGIKL